jgi:hypothetical protein
VSNLIVTNTSYNILNQPFILIEGVKNMVWDMYETFDFDDKYEDYIPSWEYYCEGDNEFGDFYDEVMSYLAFEDFDHYKYLNNEEEMDKWHNMFDEHGTELDEDFVNLFGEMRLVMMDSADSYTYFPIVQVW